MKYLIIGLDNSEGDFAPAGSDKTFHYNNVLIHTINYETAANNGGYKTAILKIKANDFNNCLARSGLARGDLLYNICDIFFNQYTTLEKIQVLSKTNFKIEPVK